MSPCYKFNDLRENRIQGKNASVTKNTEVLKQ